MSPIARPVLPGPTGLLALVGGALLLSLGVLVASELLTTWAAVWWADSAVDSRSLTGPSTGAVWYTGDGSAVSRGRGTSLLTTHSLVWGLPLLTVTVYGLRLCLSGLADDARTE